MRFVSSCSRPDTTCVRRTSCCIILYYFISYDKKYDKEYRCSTRFRHMCVSFDAALQVQANRSGAGLLCSRDALDYTHGVVCMRNIINYNVYAKYYYI